MRPTRSHALVLASALGMSFILIHSYALKLAGVSSIQQVLLRIAIATPMLFVVLGRGRALRRPGGRELGLILALGLVFTLFLFSALSAVALGLPVAVAVALVYTQPIYTAIISALTGEERPSAWGAATVILGTLGAFLATGLSVEEIMALRLGPGLLPGLLSGFLYALYLALKRQARSRGLSPQQITCFTFASALVMTGLLVIALLGLGLEDPRLTALAVPNAYQLALLASFAIVSTALPYTCLNFVNPREILPQEEGLLLLVVPALHVFWAFLIFKQAVSVGQYVGVALILSASAICHISRGKRGG